MRFHCQMLHGRYQVTWKYRHLHIIQYTIFYIGAENMRYKTTNQKIAMSKDGKPPTQQTFRTLSRPDVSCTTKSRRLAGDNGSRLKTQGTTDWT